MAVYTCPKCNTKYKVPDNAAGKKVRCKKCQHVSRIPADEGPIPVADGPDFFSEAAAAAERAAERATAGSTGSWAGGADPLEDTQALKQAQRLVEAGRQPDTRPAGRTFWGDVGWSFLFITEPGNIVTFVFVWMLFLAAQIVLFAGPCIGFAAWLILTGWIWAFLLNCVAETASGEDDLPKLTMTEGFLDDVIIPFVKYLGTSLILAVPPVLYLIVAGGLVSQGLRGALSTVTDFDTLFELGATIVTPFLILVAISVFLWPIAILVVTLSGVADLFRIDLMLKTVLRSFVPYFATFILVAVSFALRFVVADRIQTGGIATAAAFLSANKLALLLLGLGATAFLKIAAMRIIGLYYRHYKHRFAWAWE